MLYVVVVRSCIGAIFILCVNIIRYVADSTCIFLGAIHHFVNRILGNRNLTGADPRSLTVEQLTLKLVIVLLVFV